MPDKVLKMQFEAAKYMFPTMLSLSVDLRHEIPHEFRLRIVE